MDSQIVLVCFQRSKKGPRRCTRPLIQGPANNRRIDLGISDKVHTGTRLARVLHRIANDDLVDFLTATSLSRRDDPPAIRRQRLIKRLIRPESPSAILAAVFLHPKT